MQLHNFRRIDSEIVMFALLFMCFCNVNEDHAKTSE